MNLSKLVLPSVQTVGKRFAATAAGSTKVALPDLSYDYNALEPFISADIMKIHHSKHHQTYVNNFNVALEQYAEAEAKQDFTKMIALQGALKFNGGGHINHSIFWQNMKAGGGEKPTGELAELINKSFGSFENFKKTFCAQSAAVQGSGWGWLGYSNGSVSITTCANQDPLTTATPLLGVDVWEHAYYLQYKNVRPDYLGAFFNVINWDDVSARLAAAKK